VALADVPAQGKPQSKNKAELWNEFKAGRITAATYAELTK